MISLIEGLEAEPPTAAKTHRQKTSLDLNATFVAPENHSFIFGQIARIDMFEEWEWEKERAAKLALGIWELNPSIYKG